MHLGRVVPYCEMLILFAADVTFNVMHALSIAGSQVAVGKLFKLSPTLCI